MGRGTVRDALTNSLNGALSSKADSSATAGS